jgi:hypothetical protein
MGRRMRLVTSCVLALAVPMGIASLGVVSAGAQGEPIRVDLGPGGRFAHLDFDGDGRTDTGDRSTGRGPVLDPATGDGVGRYFFECIATTRIVVEDQRGTWLCTIVLEMLDGHLILQGEDPAGVGPGVLAVTGGTGLFSNARGEADFVDVSLDGPSELSIHLEP